MIEADESDRSFLKLARDVAVMTNVELDHHSTYPSMLALEEAFGEFAEPAGLRVLGPGLDSLRGAGESVSFGIEEGDLQARRLQPAPGRIELHRRGRGGGAACARAPQRPQRARRARRLPRRRSRQPPEAGPALRAFTGAGRRFEEHGRTPAGALVSTTTPTTRPRCRATLEAARTLEPRRLIACFQPHLYSRTRMLAREFGRALALADVVVVLDIYPARERAEDFPGVSGLLVAGAAADAAGGRPVWWLPQMADAARMLRSELREGDLLLTLGAGDVDRLAKELAE